MYGERGQRGEKHHNAKLTERDVERIRRLREDGVQYKVIARAFDVSKRNIGAICRFEKWRPGTDEYT